MNSKAFESKLAILASKNERPKDGNLCESCRYGDTCCQSDKGISFAKHSICWKYEGGRQ